MGTFITSPLQRGESGLSPFFVAEEGDLKLSFVTVPDISARDGIPEWKRISNMQVRVLSENKIYQLGSDLTILNQTWTLIESTIPFGIVTESLLFDTDGFIKSSLIRNLFINDSYVVDSEVAMLALTTTTGNAIIRTDTGNVFIKLNNSDPSILADFANITGNTGAVTSVFGTTGVVDPDLDTILARGSNLSQLTALISNNSTVLGNSSAITTLQNSIGVLSGDLNNVIRTDGIVSIPTGNISINLEPNNTVFNITKIRDNLTNANLFALISSSLDFSKLSSFSISEDRLGAGVKATNTSSGFFYINTVNNKVITRLGYSAIGSITDTVDPADTIILISEDGAIFGSDQTSKILTDRHLIDRGFANGNYWKNGGVTNLNSLTTINANFGLELISDIEFNCLDRSQTAGFTITSDPVGDGSVFLGSNLGSIRFDELDLGGRGSGILLEDIRTVKKGLEYTFTNYAGLTTDSLVTKGFSDTSYWKNGGITELTDNVNILGGAVDITYSTIGDIIHISNFFNAITTFEQLLLDGAGNVVLSGANNSITLNASGVVIQDNTGTGGVRLGADYSDNYVDRSLIDKEFADNTYIKFTGNTIIPITNNGLNTGDIWNDNGTLKIV